MTLLDEPKAPATGRPGPRPGPERARPRAPDETTPAARGRRRTLAPAADRAQRLPAPALAGPSTAAKVRRHSRVEPRARAALQRFGPHLLVATLVLAFTRAWTGGELTIDGPGVSMWLQVLLDHWRDGHGLAYWMPELWTGTPFFALFPSLHLLIMLPVAAVFGPDAAVRTATIAAQVVAAWGAVTLARSLWGRQWPAVIAGIAYGCHPYFAISGPLSGHEASVWVMAITPWLVWSLRRALRGDGSLYVVIAALCGAFAVLQQAEHAFGLALLASLLIVVAAVRARRVGPGHGPGPGPGRSEARRVLVRAGAVGALATGLTAFWMVPFLAMKNSFILTPRDDARATLDLLSGALGRRPGAFLTRAGSSVTTYDFNRLITEFVDMRGTVAASFYLGWACVVLTLVAVVLLARRTETDDGTLATILIASVLGIWLSLGNVPLAGSNLTRNGGVVAFVLIGSVAGLLIASTVRRLGLKRWGVPLMLGLTALLFAAPYISPILAIQRVTPLLQHIRFPRFYPMAALGVALGAAYPFVALARLSERRSPRLAGRFGAAMALLVCGVIALDYAPYRSFYRIRQPEHAAAYRTMFETLKAAPYGDRVAVMSFYDPHLMAELVKRGYEVTMGWPHPLPSKDIANLLAASVVAPIWFRDQALGLAGAGWLLNEKLGGPSPSDPVVERVDFYPNPFVQPIVRAYERIAVLSSTEVQAELAVALSRRHVSAVSGVAAGDDLAGVEAIAVTASHPCRDGEDGPLAADVEVACSLHRWLGEAWHTKVLDVGEGVGSVIHLGLPGLRGISLLMDAAHEGTTVTVYEVAPDGVSLGAEVRNSTWDGFDENGMSAFLFEPITEPSVTTIAFLVTCPTCPADAKPRVLEVASEGEAAFTTGQGVRTGRALASTVLYDVLPPGQRSATELQYLRPAPGQWSIRVDAPRPALIVVAEAHFPGWKATIDGRTASTVTADGGFIGVPVPAGRHHVRLSFHKPTATIPGRLITVASLALCALVVVRGWHRRRNPDREHQDDVPAAPPPPRRLPKPAPAPASANALGEPAVPASTKAWTNGSGTASERTPVLRRLDQIDDRLLDRLEKRRRTKPRP